MYGARYYLAYLGYGAMPIFQDDIIWCHGNFWLQKKKSSIPFFHQYGTVPYRIPKVSQITLMKYVHMHISSNVPQPTCRGPYAWLQYPYNILNLLASRFGAVWLLAIILESYAATLA